MKTKAMTIQGVRMQKQLSIQSPQQLQKLSTILRHHITEHKLFTIIRDKAYAHVEGWQFAGGMTGLYAVIENVENVSPAGGKHVTWKAEAVVYNSRDGKVVSRGFAICSDKEGKKKSFDEYAILSMAQTRAIGKAYRNVLGWVMKLSGYEATPSEEMRKYDDAPKEPTAQGMNEKIKDIAIECVGPKGKGCPGGQFLTPNEREYSKRVYGRALCRDCQKESKAKK